MLFNAHWVSLWVSFGADYCWKPIGPLWSPKHRYAVC